MRAFVAALLVLAWLPAAADEARPDSSPGYLLDAPSVRELSADELAQSPSARRFPLGERLEYRVGYYGVPVGRAVIEVARAFELDGRRVVHLVASARTNDFFSRIYPVRDRSEAWIDLERGTTLRTATHTRHGRSKETTETVRFDWDTHLVHVSEHKRHKDRLCTTVLDFGPDVYDTFDVFYAIRALPLEPGGDWLLPVYASGKVYSLQVSVGKLREVSSFPLGGRTAARVLRPSNVLDGEPQRDGRGLLLVSDDARRVPIRLDGWFRSNEGVRLGGVKVELVGFQPGERAQPAAAEPVPARLRAGPSREGRPLWEPPAAILAARAAVEVVPESGRQRDCEKLSTPVHSFALVR